MRVLKEPEVPRFRAQIQCQRCDALLEVLLEDLYAVRSFPDPRDQRDYYGHHFDCGRCGSREKVSVPLPVAQYLDKHAVRGE